MTFEHCRFIFGFNYKKGKCSLEKSEYTKKLWYYAIIKPQLFSLMALTKFAKFCHFSHNQDVYYNSNEPKKKQSFSK